MIVNILSDENKMRASCKTKLERRKKMMMKKKKKNDPILIYVLF
jgi:hypothetical protein